ncbi:MAG: DUF3784 domain-containing protein [Clostridia bacterium]|nr:DUF3784 domain-containing protein [Clostridia bacterium]
MTPLDIITAVFVFILAAACLFLAIRHFMQRGFLLNNAYIFASKQERESMDKKPHYMQSAVLFALLSAGFIATGLSIVLKNAKLLFYVLLPICVIAIVYAIVSSVRDITKK